MNKTAIASFFQHGREVTARQKAWEKKQAEKVEQVVVPEDDPSFKKEVDELDFLLKRNWFVDNDDLNDLLWSVNEDVFQEILTRIPDYPSDVQQVLATFLPMNDTIRSHIRLKIREISDAEMEKQELLNTEAQKKQFREAWEAYMNTTKLQPPVGELDAEYDEMYTNLQEAKKNLELVKKKSLSGKYVPPGMRDKVIADDPDVIKAQKNIEKMENELVYQKQRIEQEHNGWFFRKRCEFEQKMLSV